MEVIMKNRKIIFLKHLFNCIIIVLILATALTACGKLKSISTQFDNRMEDAIRSFDYAINILSQESANWQVTVANLEKELSEDLQSTIRHEITDLVRNAILSTGAELRCNAEYMRIKVRRELIDIRNRQATALNDLLASRIEVDLQIPLIPQDPVIPYICDIVPSSINLSINKERRSKIDIYGFDFRSLPLKASYKTYGRYQSASLTGASSFLDNMANRYRSYKKAIILRDSLLAVENYEIVPESNFGISRESIHTDSFSLIAPGKLFNHDISNAISIISDFHAVLNLSGSGANLPPNAKEVILSCDDKIICEIPIITHEKVLECTIKDTTINLSEYSFIPMAITSDGKHPDLDYDGNGPCMKIQIQIYIAPSKRSIIADLFMIAYECKDDFSKFCRDYTQAFERRQITLFTLTDTNTSIEKINTDPILEDELIDFKTDKDQTRKYSSNSPAYEIKYIGDTKGNEAGSETGAIIYWNPLKLKIQRCEYK